eukprot:g6702.t1
MFRESEVFSSSLVSRGKIRVLVLPVGKIPSETFDHYFKILCKFSCIPLQLLVPPKLTEDTKDSVFQYQSWSYGAVYFEFVNGYKAKGLASAKNDSLPLLTDLHLYKSTLAVFGICHCPSTGDLAKTFGNFLIEADRKAPKSILRHCFAFDVTDTQLAEPGKFSGLEDFTIFVADRNSSDGAGSILEMQMQVDLGDICTRLIHSLSKMVEDGLNGKSSPTLRNGMDAQLAKEDAIMRNKQKKKWELRHQARLRKWAGDFCLLAAAPTDALQHYTMALSMMKQNGKPVDHLWYASAHEGHAAATVMATIEALDTFSSVVAVAVGALFQLAKLTDNHDLATVFAVETLPESAKTPPKEARIKKILKAKLEVEDLFGLSGNGTDISSWALPNSIYDAQRAIAKNLSVITGGLMPDVNVNMSNIPKLVSIEALPLKSSLRHYRNEDEQDANKMGAHGTKIYYDPFAKIEKKAKQIEWIEQEIAEVKVTLENSLLIPVHVQHIAMVSPGNGQNIEAYGQSVYIPAKTTQSVILTLKPLSKGRLVLDRVSVTMFNLRK